MRKETLEKNYPCSTKEIRDEAYEQGKADGAKDFAEWLLVNHTLDCIECNHGDKTINCKECAKDYIAEWQNSKIDKNN